MVVRPTVGRAIGNEKWSDGGSWNARLTRERLTVYRKSQMLRSEPRIGRCGVEVGRNWPTRSRTRPFQPLRFQSLAKQGGSRCRHQVYRRPTEERLRLLLDNYYVKLSRPVPLSNGGVG